MKTKLLSSNQNFLAYIDVYHFCRLENPKAEESKSSAPTVSQETNLEEQKVPKDGQKSGKAKKKSKKGGKSNKSGMSSHIAEMRK